jgi:TRAP-type mannitol/chloroaromatic compound transport system permease small subunit
MNLAWLRKLAANVLRVMDLLTEVIGRTVSFLAIFMMLLTCAVVVLRYAFDTGAVMLQESVIYMHGTIFMLGAAYALRHDAHVRVDFIYASYTPRGRAIVNLAGHLLLLVPLCLFIIDISWDYVARSWRIMEGSREVGGYCLMSTC